MYHRYIIRNLFASYDCGIRSTRRLERCRTDPEIWATAETLYRHNEYLELQAGLPSEALNTDTPDLSVYQPFL